MALLYKNTIIYNIIYTVTISYTQPKCSGIRVGVAPINFIYVNTKQISKQQKSSGQPDSTHTTEYEF